ncbi:hypothetical protein [Burkholderia sp. LMU1-1-1.1]|uniref:hypothetical protein n=1 Tax=Burkholderia sp. LMU1-1-1.1 TaxID=3135266 RepID=UPI00342DE99C
MKIEYEILWHLVFGHDYGDRLQCLTLEAPFLSEETFSIEVWREVNQSLADTQERAAAYNALSDYETLTSLYEHYVQTRPQLNGACIAVGAAGPIWAFHPIEPQEENYWFGWPDRMKDGSFERVEILPCTDKVLDEVIRRGPGADSSIIRVKESPFDRFYHADELRPTHSYQRFQR